MLRAMTGYAKEVRAMRHDPAGAAIVIMLRSLKLPEMALAVNDLLEQGHPRSMQPFRYYHGCLKL